MTDWQPIETAPTTGRGLILVTRPGGFPQVVYSNSWWVAGFSHENKPTLWMPIPPTPPAYHWLSRDAEGDRN